NWRNISWNVSWNYTDSIKRSSGNHHDDNNDDFGKEQIFMFSRSIPLSGWMEDSYVNYSLTQNNHHESTMQVGLNGTMLEGRNLSYNVQ
ncbi:fimbria/pilus outer membrane usher protein, partial [Escherichia coli]|uniref:fimbria/pilus outer membrane usher protein n=1 Tax=Escherichia coli TaxID=562 RepID=UPI003CFE3999